VYDGEQRYFIETFYLLINTEICISAASKFRRQIRARIVHKKREEWWMEKAKES
jgi:hypothetical protein